MSETSEPLVPDLAIRTIWYKTDEEPRRIECYREDLPDVTAGNATPTIVLDYGDYVYEILARLTIPSKEVPPEL